MVWCFS